MHKPKAIFNPLCQSPMTGVATMKYLLNAMQVACIACFLPWLQYNRFTCYPSKLRFQHMKHTISKSIRF